MEKLSDILFIIVMGVIIGNMLGDEWWTPIAAPFIMFGIPLLLFVLRELIWLFVDIYKTYKEPGYNPFKDDLD